MERESKTDKFAVEVQKSKNVVGHIMIGKTGRFAKTIFQFLQGNQHNSCVIQVTGEALSDALV